MIKTYKSVETWAKAMQKDSQKKLWHDWFKIGGHWYTCEEYDESGKYMRYTSVTAWKHIDIDTSNRYSSSWLSDMTATEYAIESLRFDVSYYLESDQIKKMGREEILALHKNLSKIGADTLSLLDLVLEK